MPYIAQINGKQMVVVRRVNRSKIDETSLLVPKMTYEKFSPLHLLNVGNDAMSSMISAKEKKNVVVKSR